MNGIETIVFCYTLLLSIVYLEMGGFLFAQFCVILKKDKLLRKQATLNE